MAFVIVKLATVDLTAVDLVYLFYLLVEFLGFFKIKFDHLAIDLFTLKIGLLELKELLLLVLYVLELHHLLLVLKVLQHHHALVEAVLAKEAADLILLYQIPDPRTARRNVIIFAAQKHIAQELVLILLHLALLLRLLLGGHVAHGCGAAGCVGSRLVYLHVLLLFVLLFDFLLDFLFFYLKID